MESINYSGFSLSYIFDAPLIMFQVINKIFFWQVPFKWYFRFSCLISFWLSLIGKFCNNICRNLVSYKPWIGDEWAFSPYKHDPKGRRISIWDHELCLFQASHGTEPSKIWHVFGNDFPKLGIGPVICCNQHDWYPCISGRAPHS